MKSASQNSFGAVPEVARQSVIYAGMKPLKIKEEILALVFIEISFQAFRI